MQKKYWNYFKKSYWFVCEKQIKKIYLFLQYISTHKSLTLYIVWKIEFVAHV